MEPMELTDELRELVRARAVAIQIAWSWAGFGGTSDQSVYEKADEITEYICTGEHPS